MPAPSVVLDYTQQQLDDALAEDAAWRQGPRGTAPLRDRHGRMAPVPAYMRLDLLTDFDGPVPEHRPDLGSCWLWRGAPTNGYGYVRIGKRKVQAYRVNFERWVGPVPDGLLLDHLCRVRLCVHPLHVEPATWAENARRSPIHDAVRRAARDQCVAGHPFDEVNTYRAPGATSRQCRTCRAAEVLRNRPRRARR